METFIFQIIIEKQCLWEKLHLCTTVYIWLSVHPTYTYNFVWLF